MHGRFAVSIIALSAVLAACGGNQPEANAPPPPPPEAPGASTAPNAAAPATTGVPPETADAAAATAATAEATNAAPADAGPPPRKSWNDLSHDERLALMKSEVMPKMKAAFQGFDAKDFEKFSCVTCHGEDAKKGKFDMPNPKLPKLNPKDGFAAEKKKHAKTLDFMMKTVTPQMADLLNLPKYDPATGQGFGCGNCHTMTK